MRDRLTLALAVVLAADAPALIALILARLA